MVDRELTERDNRRMQTRLRAAKLKQNTALEDVDFKRPRGLDRSLILKLADCQWVAGHLNVLVTGPTGIGKTWLACALAHKACREGYRSYYVRLPPISNRQTSSGTTLAKPPLNFPEGRFKRRQSRLLKREHMWRTVPPSNFGSPTWKPRCSRKAV